MGLAKSLICMQTRVEINRIKLNGAIVETMLQYRDRLLLRASTETG